ncbi:hypothetical protein GALMADRAFT_565426 [Galerina marginata CBS 339.88]|uniref:Uncharacterized protein n=1 Tax=Galerina marginata (strain CBS 339.88) TaxID=685588 RepID=A0A067SVE4_GALM3|nr:hypothetical protein GALMADRAFT_565426 [Galerina marginata CBS 339.88]
MGCRHATIYCVKATKKDLNTFSALDPEPEPLDEPRPSLLQRRYFPTTAEESAFPRFNRPRQFHLTSLRTQIPSSWEYGLGGAGRVKGRGGRRIRKVDERRRTRFWTLLGCHENQNYPNGPGATFCPWGLPCRSAGCQHEPRSVRMQRNDWSIMSDFSLCLFKLASVGLSRNHFAQAPFKTGDISTCLDGREVCRT